MTDYTKQPVTERDLAALRLIADGAGLRKVARVLGISQYAAGQLATRLYLKLGAINAANAVYIACQRGLLPIDPVEPKGGAR